MTPAVGAPESVPTTPKNHRDLVAAIDVAKHPGGPWVAKLAQCTVELIGVVESPGARGCARWKPDGSAANVAPFSNGAIEFSTPSEEPSKRPRLILLHIRDLPDDSPWPVFRFEPSIGLRYLERPGSARDNALRNYYLLYTLLDSSTPTAKLRVGIDSGAWETVITQQPDRLGEASYSRDGKVWKVTFLGTKMAGKCDDTTVVTLKTDEPEGTWRMRLVAIARDGSEHPSWISSGRGLSTSSGVGTGTASFDRLPLSSIKEFRLQVRPFSWVEFSNIALQPSKVSSTEKTPAVPSNRYGGNEGKVLGTASELPSPPVASSDVSRIQSKPPFQARLPNERHRRAARRRGEPVQKPPLVAARRLAAARVGRTMNSARRRSLQQTRLAANSPSD